MKKVFTFLAFTLIFAACNNNVAKFKPMIEELAGNWDSTTSSVADFANVLNKEQTGLMNLTNGFQIDPTIVEKWDADTATKFSTIKAMVQNNSNGLAAISSDLDGFMSSWKEKGNDLKALKDGLAAGKLGDDVQDKITALTTAVTDATSKLDGWKGQVSKIKEAVAKATQMFNEFKEANKLG